MSEIEKKNTSRFSEISIIANKGPQLNTLADVWSVAQMYHSAGMMPQGVRSAQQLLVILMAGAELGFGPTWALRNIAAFNGQALLHTDGPISVVMASGQLEWQRSGFDGEAGTDAYAAWFEVKRRGVVESVRRTFSVDDAKTAGLWGKNIWKSYPTRMLLMRARAYALRDLFADVLGGIGIREELEGMQPAMDEVASTGSAGLLNALTAPQDAEGELLEAEFTEAPAEPMEAPVAAPNGKRQARPVVTDDDPPVDLDALAGDPSEGELAEIRARELHEAGLFDEVES